jgi:RNA recognition motif-containing protein
MEFSKGVVLRGLPFAATEDDVKQFFKSMDIPYENIRLIRFRDGKTTGFGFVKLASVDDVEHALLMDKNHIGSRYIEVYPSDETELHHLQLMARSGSEVRELNRFIGTQIRDAKRKDHIRRKLLTRYAYISGVPPGHQYKEVRRFFQGRLIGRNCIHLLKERGSSEFSGEGYIEFSDNDECRKALAASGQRMGNSVINVEPCPEEEFVDMVGIDQIQDSGRDRRGSSDRSSRRRERTPSPARRRMMAYTKTYGGRDGEDDDYYHEREGRIRDTIASMAYGGEASYYPHSHPPTAPAMHSQPYRERSPISHHTRGGWGSVEDTPAGYGSHRGLHVYGSSAPPTQHATGGYSRQTYAPDDIRYALGGSSGASSAGSSMGGVYGASMGGVAHSDVGSERKVVRIEGLPYDVMVQEILDFFRGYHVNYENVRIQCRDDGSPSGKAFVTFPSEKLARHAIADLNRHYIRGRFVELFIL